MSTHAVPHSDRELNPPDAQDARSRVEPWLTVIGIGDDGFAGLGRAARRALFEASVVYGGERHLAMLPARMRARREPWPRPFDVAAVLAHREAAQSICVLASGDPMLF